MAWGNAEEIRFSAATTSTLLSPTTVSYFSLKTAAMIADILA